MQELVADVQRRVTAVDYPLSTKDVATTAAQGGTTIGLGAPWHPTTIETRSGATAPVSFAFSTLSFASHSSLFSPLKFVSDGRNSYGKILLTKYLVCKNNLVRHKCMLTWISKYRTCYNASTWMHTKQDKILLTEGIAGEDKFGISRLENGEVYMPRPFVDQSVIRLPGNVDPSLNLLSKEGNTNKGNVPCFLNRSPSLKSVH